ncbi:MAG: hypothetical protein SFY56_00620 [Bacteroidota bacterium]|nr:hypothetical protein [Bacteroidota bacterium]
MKLKIFFTASLFLNLNASQLFSQAKQLTAEEIKENDISEFTKLPVYKAFSYNDKGGYYVLFYCEDQLNKTKKDTTNTKIGAHCLLHDHGGFVEKWKITDVLDTKIYPDGGAEKNIWFWTKYCSHTDIDGDKLIDPIIVYGTKTDEGFNRIKIFTVYKGKKYVIRAVECVLDNCRTFKKDESYSQLPKSVNTYINNLLEKIRKEQNVILQNG